MYEYQGRGEFIPGVPARNLTDAEAKEFGVTKNPLYKKRADEPAENKRAKGTEDK